MCGKFVRSYLFAVFRFFFFLCVCVCVSVDVSCLSRLMKKKNE